MQIPSFLLRKLYIKGSLENVEDGFQFKLKNSLSPATAIGMDPIKVDDHEYSLDKISISIGDEKINGSEVSEDSVFPIKVGVEILLHVQGEQLPEGEHKIDIALKTKEAGNLAFDVKDSI